MVASLEVLAGRPATVGQRRSRLFSHGPAAAGGGGQSHQHHLARGVNPDDEPDCSLGLIRYGNESVGIWGAVAAKSNPAWIAQRVEWITPKPRPEGGPRRRGPASLAMQNQVDSRIHFNA